MKSANNEPTTARNTPNPIFADGTGDATVTDGTDFSTFPSWSPDGRKLAFMAQHDGAWQVYIIGANGARLTSLTSGSGTNLFPVWTPAAP